MPEQRAEYEAPPEDTTPQQEPEVEQQEPEEGAEPAPEQQQPEAPKQPQHVPLAALHEARRESKEAKARADRLEQNFAYLQQRIDQASMPQPQAEPEIVVPDRNADFIGWMDAQEKLKQREFAQLRQNQEQIAQQVYQRQQWEYQQAQEQQLVSAYKADVRQFSREAPDFNEAYQSWTNRRYQDWINSGYGEEEAQHNLRLEERAIVVRAMHNGRSPSEAVYNIAKSYRSPNAQPSGDMPRGQDGRFLPSQQPPQQLRPVGRSLSTASGSPGGPGSIKDIAGLPPDEFRKATEGDAWLKLIRGR